jgi:hypothetical protein
MPHPHPKTSTKISALACLVTLVGQAAAQTLKWDMPSRGARVYTRSCDRFELLATDVGQSAQLSQTLFSDYRAPSLLLTGELDDEGRALKHSPVELREVGNWLAMDLGYGLGGGPVKTVASRVYCFGDLQITGRASGIDADGWQTFDLQIASTAEPATNGDSRAFIEQHVKPHIRNRFEGELTITRRVVRNDDKTAFVADLRSELAGDIYEQAQGGGKLATLRYQETWRHDSIHENQDAAFQAKVVASLKRATDYLRNQLADPNHVEIRRSGDAKSDTRLALVLLAMIKGGVPRDDATVLQSLAELRDRQLTYTSALSHAIMAVEAYQAPETELVELKTGKLELPANRKLEPADAKRVQEWVAQLLKNVDADCDIKETLRFSELGGSGYDNLVE